MYVCMYACMSLSLSLCLSATPEATSLGTPQKKGATGGGSENWVELEAEMCSPSMQMLGCRGRRLPTHWTFVTVLSNICACSQVPVVAYMSVSLGIAFEGDMVESWHY